MPRAKDPQEPQLALLFEIPAVLPIDIVRRQRLAFEGRLPIIRHRLGRSLVAEPITYPVRVPGPDHGLYARLDDVRQLGEEAAGVVPRGGEFLVGRVGAFLVGGLGTDGFDNVGLFEVGDVGFGGVRVVGRGADVVDVEVVGGDAAIGGGGGEGAFDRVVTSVV